MRAYFRDLWLGLRVLASRRFWRAFCDYWHPDHFVKWANDLDRRSREGEFGKWPWQKDYGLWPWQRRRKP